MSGLWDYGDEDDLQDLDNLKAPSPAAIEEEEEEPQLRKKRKPGRKPGNAGPRAKRRAVSPVLTDLSLKPAVDPNTIVLMSSDDEDDVLTLPEPNKPRDRASGAGGAVTPSKAKPSTATAVQKPTVDLDPATRQALAKEQELLFALREVTSRQQDDTHDGDVLDPGPVPSTRRLPPLGFPRLSSRLPSAFVGLGATGAGISAGGAGGCSDKGGSVGGLAAESVDLSDAAGVSNCGGRAGSAEPGAGPEADASGTMGPSAAAEPAAEDRVRLKLAWQSGKDGHLMMRVVKTDPLSKMMEKFRAIARDRNLCKDPSKIKFIFDGDDLAKTPKVTAEELDLEDDMIIDIKL